VCVVFDSGDTPYLAWLNSHQNGYLINILRHLHRDKHYPTLHRARCYKIQQDPPGHYTDNDYIKVCAESEAALGAWVSANVLPPYDDNVVLPNDGTFQKRCGTCRP
jgi:hypothetical protein